MALVLYRHKRRGRAALAVAAGVFAAAGVMFSPAAWAQSVTQSHLQAARQAIAAIHATDQFDSFLPDTAVEIKNDLSRRDPNLAATISKTVDEQTMLLVPRRTDLEKEVARIYARTFSEAELAEIAKFYGSPTGKKLLKQGPAAMAESVGAYDIWRQGVAQDLAVAVGKALDAKLSAAAAKGKPQAPNFGQSDSRPALKLGQ